MESPYPSWEKLQFLSYWPKRGTAGRKERSHTIFYRDPSSKKALNILAKNFKWYYLFTQIVHQTVHQWCAIHPQCVVSCKTWKTIYLKKEIPTAEISRHCLVTRKGLRSYTLHEDQADKSLPVICVVRMNYSPAFEASLKSFSYAPMIIMHVIREEADSKATELRAQHFLPLLWPPK